MAVFKGFYDYPTVKVPRFTIVTEGNGTGDLAIHRVDLIFE